MSLLSDPRLERLGHPLSELRDIILLAVRYYLQLGAAAERIAGILADRGIDVERTDDPALGPEVRAGSGRRDPPPSKAVEHGLAGG